VFGAVNLPQGLPSLCGPRLLARSSPRTTLGNGMLSWLTDATCVRRLGRPWIISFSTAMWLLFCGILSSAVSECLELCPDRLLTCLRVSGPLEDQGALRFGKWHLSASFDAYGGKETIGVLRTWKVPWKRSFPRSTIPCIFGPRLMSTLYLFLFLTFSLVFLFLAKCFPCILLMY
jgi:hypothetical protein